MKEKKKKSLLVTLIISLSFFIILLILFSAGWVIFCLIDTIDPSDSIPENFNLYLQSDSLWDSVEPLLDLQAADVFLSDPKFSDLRGTFLGIRASELRANSLVKNILSRRVDVVMYSTKENKSQFFAVVKMDVLSSISRIASFAVPFLKIQNLAYVSSASYSYFEYRAGDTTVYIKPYKNLLLISLDRNIMKKSVDMLIEKRGNEKAHDLFLDQNEKSIRIAIDAGCMMQFLPQDNPLINKLALYLPDSEFGELSFNITDAEIEVELRSALEINSETDHFGKIISRDSTLPTLPGKMPNTTQYYTLFNAGTLEELKDAVIPFLSPSVNFSSTWTSAQSMSNLLFSLSLEELLFSWTGKEIAVIGLEGKIDPIFALQIKDESKRKIIFDKFISSIIIQDGKSLIYNGVRIPSLKVPPFLQKLLKSFGIDLPNPYYLVKDGFIYFSESPENLSELFFADSRNMSILKNENWAGVSSNVSPEFSAGLFYDLERSLPFFIRGNSSLSQVLKLYNIGRTDLSIKKGELIFTLHANAKRNVSILPVYGFPIQLERSPSPSLEVFEGKDASHIYWLEDERFIIQLDTKTLKTRSVELSEKSSIVKASSLNGELWAVTAQGAVYLFDGDLQSVDGFPVLTGEKMRAACTIINSSLLYPAENNIMCIVSPEGSINKISITANGTILSTPSVNDDLAVVYAKSFSGEIYYFNEVECTNAFNPLKVNGIAYGSPSVVREGDSVYIGFITQAGMITVWENDEILSGFPVQLDGVFYSNVQSLENYFIALAEDGTLYRIDLAGNILSVKIPGYTAKSGTITILNFNKDKNQEVFINPDGAVIYGFNSSLELLPSFPRPGWGKPVFADLNGDKKKELISATVDKKITAWMVE